MISQICRACGLEKPLSDYYKHESYKELRDLPYYLIDLVHQFYSIETIHLIRQPESIYDGGGHWAMSVDDLINNS